MKAVLLSTRPRWCWLIAIGRKLVEVRKTRPKIDTPFKCLIYETKGKSDVPTFIDEDGHYIYEGRGQVIGEFVCDRIIEFDAPGGLYRVTPNFIEKECCLSMPELQEYGYDAKTNSYKNLYGWHISDLVIYDKPKELSEFHRPCTPACNYSNECEGTIDPHCLFGISRAPQSWCYVEEFF